MAKPDTPRVGAWQARPLEPMYPVVFFDAAGEDSRGRSCAQQGHLPGNGGPARRHRTTSLIAVTDGLKGIGEALGAVFPATTQRTELCSANLVSIGMDVSNPTVKHQSFRIDHGGRFT